MTRLYAIIFCFSLAAPAIAQVPVPAQTAILEAARQLAAEGYFDRCAAGELRGCSLFARLAALRANPTADRGSYGWLTKAPGESQVDGYADDAVVYSDAAANVHNVIDLVGGAGAPGARVQLGGPHPRRPHNIWEAPRPLSAADLAYLRPGSSPTTPTPTPPDLKTILDAIAQLQARVDAIERALLTISDGVAETRTAALSAQAQASAAAAGVAQLLQAAPTTACSKSHLEACPEYESGGWPRLVLRPRP